jgi:uncharacterized protein YdhG (YjbR/CyaY superfamily)
MPAKPKTVDECLARVNDVQRAALEKLRRDIKAVAPAAEECISYGIPSYRLDSKLLVCFCAAKRPAPSTSVLTRFEHTARS